MELSNLDEHLVAEHASAELSPDERYLLVSYSTEPGIEHFKVWFLDWELHERNPAGFADEAQPFVENFLTIHTPYAAELPAGQPLTEQEIVLALTRRGKPSWSEGDFQHLLQTLGCAGYGWLRPEGVRCKLEELAAIRSAGE